MAQGTRFVHTNLIAQNWRELARFYERVLGCTALPPERNLDGEWLDAVTGVAGAQVRGIHLRLPGYGDEGPTLEIFEYNHQGQAQGKAVNRPGFAHIAFAVDDVEATRQAVLEAGGDAVGQVVHREIPGAGQLTLTYVTDPEGNIIELLRWGSQPDPEDG